MDTTIAEVKLPEPVFQSEGGNVSLYHFPEHQCYSLELKGMVPVPHYKEGFNQLLARSLEVGYNRVVYKLDGLTKSDPEARAWYVKKFLPAAMKEYKEQGLRSAVISPKSTFQQMALKFITGSMNAMGYKITMKYFDSLEEALDWI